MANTKRPRECKLDGLAGEWDATPEIRQSLRSGEPLIQEVSKKHMDIMLPSKYHLLMAPILRKMWDFKLAVPSIDSLRVEIAAVLDIAKREYADADVDQYAWLIRKQVSFIKSKVRRREVSCVL